MKKIVTACIVLGCAAFVMTSFAADEAKQEKKKAGGFDPTAALVKKAADEGLPEDGDCQNQIGSCRTCSQITGRPGESRRSLTPEQKKARSEAMKAAKAAGKKGKEVQADVEAALNLSGDQKEKVEAAQKEAAAAMTSFRQAVAAQLSPEQQMKLGLGGRKKKGK